MGQFHWKGLSVLLPGGGGGNGDGGGYKVGSSVLKAEWERSLWVVTHISV